MSQFLQQENALFLHGLKICFNYDFQHYADDYIARRLDSLRGQSGGRSLLALLDELLKGKESLAWIIDILTVGTTEFFRDPDTFQLINEQLFPYFETRAHIKIWSAGCSSGKELYSLLVLLSEQGLLSRTSVYATDVSTAALEKAQRGAFSQDEIRQFIRHYTQVSAQKHASDYYFFRYNLGFFDQALLDQVTFIQHDLIKDEPLDDMDLILCRNVLIYLNEDAQNKALSLLVSSLHQSGFLVLGQSESLFKRESEFGLRAFNSPKRIYQRNTEHV